MTSKVTVCEATALLGCKRTTRGASELSDAVAYEDTMPIDRSPIEFEVVLAKSTRNVFEEGLRIVCKMT